MLTERQLGMFVRFLNGEKYTKIGLDNKITGTRVNQICQRVASTLSRRYRIEGETEGRYKGLSKWGGPYTKNIKEMREHKDFWLRRVKDEGKYTSSKA